ncbi:hypothetical protein K461DRAFT_272024 [Myriangium duriaei CBS 260.36]|uniref:2EXR domain-containing protein n=1 Tax=Myriangium duriaei CBS 260.36 TaxID=1168546 RepID=A0A9P4IRU8_9PEZI|nr:hypothetical protein K461DRAFT_272024 [Myriangium duriaei CBS 260.36]
MSESPLAPSTFHRFANLPAELRLEIWRLAVPSVGPSLVPHQGSKYRLGYFSAERSARLLETFNTDNMQVTLPLPPMAGANHEAMAAVLHHPTVVAQRDSNGKIKYMMTRAFDPQQDMVYFRSHKHHSLLFFAATQQNIAVHDLIGARHVAVPAVMLRDSPSLALRLLRPLGVIHVVCNTRIDFPGCREITKIGHGRWTWNSTDVAFDFTNSASGSAVTEGDNEEEQQTMHKATGYLQSYIGKPWTFPYPSEIRQVVVKRKQRDVTTGRL